MGRKNSKKQTRLKDGKKQRQKAHSVKSLKGVLDITRSGMGFVTVPDTETDVMVRPGDFNTALHGDTVRVRIKSDTGRRMQGEVTEVLQRKRTEFVGKLEMNKGFAFFIPQMDKPMPDIFVPLSNFNGDKDN